MKDANIYGIATKEIAPVLLHAAAFEPGSLKGIALISPLSSYYSIVDTEFYIPDLVEHTVPASLRHYDLPDLAASLAPLKLLLLNPMDASGTSDAQALEDDLSVIRKAYGQTNENNLKIIFRKTTIMPADILKWLE